MKSNKILNSHSTGKQTIVLDITGHNILIQNLCYAEIPSVIPNVLMGLKETTQLLNNPHPSVAISLVRIFFQ